MSNFEGQPGNKQELEISAQEKITELTQQIKDLELEKNEKLAELDIIPTKMKK